MLIIFEALARYLKFMKNYLKVKKEQFSKRNLEFENYLSLHITVYWYLLVVSLLYLVSISNALQLVNGKIALSIAPVFRA